MASQVRQNFAEECENAINRQINMELYASYVYLSMVSHFLLRMKVYYKEKLFRPTILIVMMLPCRDFSGTLKRIQTKNESTQWNCWNTWTKEEEKSFCRTLRIRRKSSTTRLKRQWHKHLNLRRKSMRFVEWIQFILQFLLLKILSEPTADSRYCCKCKGREFMWFLGSRIPSGASRRNQRNCWSLDQFKTRRGRLGRLHVRQTIVRNQRIKNLLKSQRRKLINYSILVHFRIDVESNFVWCLNQIQITVLLVKLIEIDWLISYEIWEFFHV